MADAAYEDGGEGPLRLIAQEPADVPVLSALLQDAVLSAGDLNWDARRRRFSALVNRFRWEDRAEAERDRRPYERARSLLTIAGALTVRSMGIDRGDADTVLSILTLDWAETGEGAGTLTLVLAGDGAIALQVEAVDIVLEDVTRPYIAPSRKVPDHGV